MFKVFQRIKDLARRQEAFEKKSGEATDKIQNAIRDSREKLQRRLDASNENGLKQRQLLLSLGNALSYSSADPVAVKNTTTYKRCAELIALLTPMDVSNGQFTRLGRDFDGGYVMLDDFQEVGIEAAYSFGINDDVSWDEAIAGRGIDVFMYDHTIEGLPKENPRFHFTKRGLTGSEPGEQLATLEELIAANRHQSSNKLLMKMDIEGCEWDVFQHTAPATLAQFTQVTLEFHKISPFAPEAFYARMVEVLGKLNQTHQSIHVHANGAGIPAWIGGLVLPSLLEVTYVRRADYASRLVPSTRQFPTSLDQPTYDNWPDIYLGNFSVPE